MHNHDIDLILPNNKDLRVEFIGACAAQYEQFPNIMSSCAFNIINSQYSCNPGTVYPDVIKAYYDEIDMKHVMLVTPFLWGDIPDIETDNKLINWLMLVPISEEEFQFLKDNGSDALEKLFEEKEIDICNLERKSIL